MLESHFNKTILDNGIRLVTENQPYSRSCTIGAYLHVGTRHEPNNLWGGAHFIEHLVFKGTKKRSAIDIVKEVESLGGDINAYTTKEHTCYHASCLQEHIFTNLDVLLDVVRNAKFEKSEFEKERQVILQELYMSEDSLEEYVFDMYFDRAYKDQNLGHPILGTKKSLENLKLKDLKKFYEKYYVNGEITLAISGKVDHQKVVSFLNSKYRKKIKPTKAKKFTKPQIKSFFEYIKKPAEQAHILMGFPSPPFTSNQRYYSYLLNAVLGDSMTSRLYQKIREEKAWAYSVYSYLQSFVDTGLLMVYAGTSKELSVDVYKEIIKQIKLLKSKGISKKEMEMFKGQVKGQLLIGAEEQESRMNSMGINDMVFGKYRSIDKTIAQIEKIQVDDLNKYANKYLNFKKMGMYVIGDLDESMVKTLKSNYLGDKNGK